MTECRRRTARVHIQFYVQEVRRRSARTYISMYRECGAGRRIHTFLCTGSAPQVGADIQFYVQGVRRTVLAVDHSVPM